MIAAAMASPEVANGVRLIAFLLFLVFAAWVAAICAAPWADRHPGGWVDRWLTLNGIGAEK